MGSQSSIIPFQSPKTKFGPRAPRHSKQTQFIRSRQAKGYEKAVKRAAALPGLSLKFITATWGLTNRAHLDDMANVKWLRQWERKWLGQPGRGVKFYDLGVREDAPDKGPHFHQLPHVPDEHWEDFQAALKAQLQPKAKGLRQRKPQRMTDCPGCGRPRNWLHLARCYFLKAGSDTVRERNGINLCAAASERTYSQDKGGLVTGKRLFHSRSLGDKANRVRVAGGVRLINNQIKSATFTPARQRQEP